MSGNWALEATKPGSLVGASHGMGHGQATAYLG